MVHTRRKKPPRPSLRSSTTPQRTMNERLQRRSASPDGLECAPHSDLSIIDCSMDSNALAAMQQQAPQASGDPVFRRKLYFNPVFFETEHLKVCMIHCFITVYLSIKYSTILIKKTMYCFRIHRQLLWSS